MIVVLDSNVWISALHFDGIPLAALRKAYVGDCIACCAQIKTEVQRTLVNKLHWRVEAVAVAMEPLLEGALEVQPAGNFKGACRDPNDDIILECAHLAQTKIIVTGDKDLLALESYSGILILTTRAYLNLTLENSLTRPSIFQ